MTERNPAGKKSGCRKWIFRIAAVLLMLAVLALAQQLLLPKYMRGIVEGALVGAYYQEKASHDVIFVGDCEVYENFSPIKLWNEYGITSFIRGSAQQLMWQSYYLLEETLRYETPRVVVLSVIAMKYNEPQKEAYNRMTLDGMRLSAVKLRAIKASMLDDERIADYLFPILRYHSRWSELTADDFRYLFRRDKLFHNGYYMRVDTKPVTTIPTGKKLPDYRFGAKATEYLNKTSQLCKEKGIELILVKAPSIYPYWYAEWDAQMKEYAAGNSHRYLNFLELADEVGIDFQTDTYDAGLHMNLSGAEKMSAYIGRILSEDYQLPDRRSDAALAAIWQEKTRFYEAMRESQIAELAEYGYLKRFSVQPPGERSD